MCLCRGILHSTHCSCLGHGLLNRNLDKLRSTQQVQISKMGQKVCRLTQFQLANICMTLAKSERGWEEKHFNDLLIATTLFPKEKRHKHASTILKMFFWPASFMGSGNSGPRGKYEWLECVSCSCCCRPPLLPTTRSAWGASNPEKVFLFHIWLLIFLPHSSPSIVEKARRDSVRLWVSKNCIFSFLFHL